METKVKFVWNGIKINGEFHKCNYSKGPYTATSGLPEGTITMYASGYASIPSIPGLTIENDTDIMTDYFETDTVRIFPDSPYYAEAEKAMKAHELHCAKRAVKHFEKLYEAKKGTRQEEFYFSELQDRKERLIELEAVAI